MKLEYELMKENTCRHLYIIYRRQQQALEWLNVCH
jgi:hypothetical protein